MNSEYFPDVNDCSQIRPGLSSLIKVDDVEDVLEEAPEKLADSMILFCQVIISSIYALLIPTQPTTTPLFIAFHSVWHVI